MRESSMWSNLGSRANMRNLLFVFLLLSVGASAQSTLSGGTLSGGTLGAAAAGGGATIFDDDFELNNLTKWTRTEGSPTVQGTTKYAGSYAAQFVSSSGVWTDVQYDVSE